MPSNEKTKKKYGLGVRKNFEHKLPSGEVCLMRRLTIDDMIELGLLDRIDSLTSIVATEHVGRVTGTPQQRAAAAEALAKLDADSAEGRKALLDVMRDKSKWESLQEFINGIVVAAVVEPELKPEPPKDHAPEWGVLYPKDVDLADRMSIMQEAMLGMLPGIQAMEPFRQGSGQAVVDLPESLQVQHASLGSVGDNG